MEHLPEEASLLLKRLRRDEDIVNHEASPIVTQLVEQGYVRALPQAGAGQWILVLTGKGVRAAEWPETGTRIAHRPN